LIVQNSKISSAGQALKYWILKIRNQDDVNEIDKDQQQDLAIMKKLTCFREIIPKGFPFYWVTVCI